MQEHTAHQLEAASMDSKSGANSRIRQVWRHNLEQEMAVLRQLIIKYPYVSMVCYLLSSAENCIPTRLMLTCHPRTPSSLALLQDRLATSPAAKLNITIRLCVATSTS
jgi:hypothetical protein